MLILLRAESGVDPVVLAAAGELVVPAPGGARIRDAGPARTPTFEICCKRILAPDGWYPALQRDNVHLATDGIREIRPHAVVTSDGTVREVDAIVVVATGFHVTDGPAADLINGVDGPCLGDVWREFGQQAYKGLAVAGFPNFFSLIGPNTGLGHTSMIYLIESQLAYIPDVLDAMDRHDLATVEVRPEAQDDYNRWIQKRMSHTVWTTGCASWYLDAQGRSTTLWPSFTFRFRSMTRRFDLAAYHCTTRATRPANKPPSRRARRRRLRTSPPSLRRS